jgi:hypothetical protein
MLYIPSVESFLHCDHEIYPVSLIGLTVFTVPNFIIFGVIIPNFTTLNVTIPNFVTHAVNILNFILPSTALDMQQFLNPLTVTLP